jgi:hypothetical protein
MSADVRVAPCRSSPRQSVFGSILQLPIDWGVAGVGVADAEADRDGVAAGVGLATVDELLEHAAARSDNEISPATPILALIGRLEFTAAS